MYNRIYYNKDHGAINREFFLMEQCFDSVLLHWTDLFSASDDQQLKHKEVKVIAVTGSEIQLTKQKACGNAQDKHF